MPILFDIDGEGDIEPLGDGLLIVRYILGYRGNILIFGAVFPGAIRTTAEDIEGYIANIYNCLDVDGNGKVELNDAILILRYMFGFTGDVLVDGMISAGATRSTAAEIEAYLLYKTTESVP